MSSKTKILVVKMREIIYTAIFLALALLLVILLIRMFTSGSSDQTNTTPQTNTLTASSSDTAQYIAGIYTTPVSLGDSTVDVEVTVDENHINSIRLVNLSETISAMYPLVSPSLETIARQICQNQSLENITCSESNKYTAQILLNAVSQALQQARRNTL